jgi:hypothetical protein
MNTTHVLLQSASRMRDGSYTRRCLLIYHGILGLDKLNDNKTENIAFSQASLDTKLAP